MEGQQLMKKLNLFFVFLFSVFFVSCSSGPESKKEDVKKASKDSSFIAKAETKAKDIEVLSMQDWSNTNCSKIKANYAYKMKEIIQNASSCVKKDDFNTLMSWAKLAGELYPKEPWNNYYLSIYHEKKNELGKSRWHIEQATLKAPNIGLLYYQLARLDWREENYVDCFNHLKKSLEFDNTNSDAHLFIAQIYFRDQDFPTASKHFYSVLNLDSKNEIAIYGLAESRAQMQDYKASVEMFDKLINIQSQKIEYFVRRANITEKNLKNIDLALKYYREIDDKYKRGSLKGNLNFDLKSKIEELNAASNKANASSQQPSKSPEQGVKK